MVDSGSPQGQVEHSVLPGEQAGAWAGTWGANRYVETLMVICASLHVCTQGWDACLLGPPTTQVSHPA